MSVKPELLEERLDDDRVFGLTCLGLIALTWALYGRCVGFEFTNWDDSTYIVGNDLLHRADMGALRQLFTPGSIPKESLYVPITYLSYWGEIRAFGLSSAMVHFVNVSLHCVNGLLVLVVCSRLARSRVAGIVAAVIFVMHPLQVESVAWAFGRKDLLATTFALAALWAWLRGGAGIGTTWKWVPLVLLLSSLSMLSKPSTLILPGLIALITAYRHGKRGLTQSTILVTGLSLVVAVALFLANRTEEYVPPYALPFSQRIGLWPYSLSAWLPRILLVQRPLTFYPWPQDYFVLRTAMGILLLIAVLTVLCVAIVKRWDIVWFAILFLAFGFAPTVSTAIGYRPFFSGDRYGYFPLIGLFLLIGYGLSKLLLHNTRLAVAVGIVACCGMGLGGFIRTSEWRTSSSLWSAQVEKSPNHHYGYGALARAIDDRCKNRLAPDGNQLRMEAQKLYLHAEKLGSKEPKVFFNMANNFYFMKRYDEAESAYYKVLALSPGNVEAMVNLGRMYIDQKRYTDAERIYHHASNFDSPHGFFIYMNLALVYENMGKLDKAINCITWALSAKPGDPDALQRLERLSQTQRLRNRKDPKTP